jgi:HTH-type transcriptional regulator/antitoxin HigA
MRPNDPTPKLPARFDALAQIMLPRAIVGDKHYTSTLAMIDRLTSRRTLTKGQALYLETLVQLVQAYEAKHHPVDTLRGVETLRHLLDENQMTAADLGRLLGVHASMGSKILKGERSLTVEHIVALSERFAVRPDVFIDERQRPARRAS